MKMGKTKEYCQNKMIQILKAQKEASPMDASSVFFVRKVLAKSHCFELEQIRLQYASYLKQHGTYSTPKNVVKGVEDSTEQKVCKAAFVHNRTWTEEFITPRLTWKNYFKSFFL